MHFSSISKVHFLIYMISRTIFVLFLYVMIIKIINSEYTLRP